MLSICLIDKWTHRVVIKHILFNTQILKLSQIWYSNWATVVIAPEIWIRCVSPSLLKIDKLFLKDVILILHQWELNLKMFLQVYNLLIKHFYMLSLPSILDVMTLYDLLIFWVEPAEIMF